MHEVLVNSLGGLSLPRKSVLRLTDRPDMTLNVNGFAFLHLCFYVISIFYFSDRWSLKLENENYNKKTQAEV